MTRLIRIDPSKRCWRVEICPPVDNPLVEPDVLVEKDGKRVYVEVEVFTKLRASQTRLAGNGNRTDHAGEMPAE